MQRRTLGANLQVSALGLGCMGMSEFYGPRDDETSLRVLAEAVERSCRNKAEVVVADETEQGERALLNLGHTFGHAIEAEMGYGVWLHGEAVAAGMVLACRLSEQLGQLTATDTERVIALLKRAALPTEPPRFSFERWIEHMQHDKKVSNSVMRFVGLNQLGQANITAITDINILQRTLAPYLA